MRARVKSNYTSVTDETTQSNYTSVRVELVTSCTSVRVKSNYTSVVFDDLSCTSVVVVFG